MSMSTNISHHGAVSNTRLWAGEILCFVPAALLFADGVMKIMRVPMMSKMLQDLGYPDQVLMPLGVVLCACVLLYLIKQTAPIGAILLTGYLGGAIASHVRMGQGPVEIVIPAAVAIVLWTGLVLCRPNLSREVLPG